MPPIHLDLAPGARANDSPAARLHLDLPLLIGLLALCAAGLAILYSAGGGRIALVEAQAMRMGLGLLLMAAVAQIPPPWLKRWSPWVYALGIALLVAVMFGGEVGKGAQRWLNLGLFRFQPSEILKLAVPMMVAAWLAERPLPPRPGTLAVALAMILIPVLLIARQPDLGTALLVAMAGFFALFMAGLSWRLLGLFTALVAAGAPLLWHFMREYQRQRVLTFLNPESDPLGSGYHIIQSMIAIGSGGVYGKGFLEGTQSHLEFLPERTTDFIFAVISEELGLTGVLVLLALYLFVIGRGLYIASHAQDSYGRILAASLTLVFFVYLFVNTGMVTGLLPVVGVPLPLVSYGGTSLVTILLGFGMLMSIHTHRRLLIA